MSITTTTTTDTNVPSSSSTTTTTTTNSILPGPSPQVQRVINEQLRVSPDVKRKAPSDTPIIQQPVTSGVNISGRLSSATPTLPSTTNNLTSGNLNDDQDEMNLSKRKTKKDKKRKENLKRIR